MAASRCPDTFVISLIADLDCYFEIKPGDDDMPADMKEFIISPGNEKAIIISFDYYIGIGADSTHADFGWHYTLDALNAGNITQMSLAPGQTPFNPPTPDLTGAPNLVKEGTFTVFASVRATVTYDDPNTPALEGANNQNVGGTIVLNTGVPEP